PTSWVMSGSMHIVCPHCTTSYAINLATLGEAGRTVRCARCKEVWLARPEDAIEPAAQPVMAEPSYSAGQRDVATEWNETAGGDGGHAPHVESPSIAGDWQDEAASTGKEDWIALVREAAGEDEEDRPARGTWFGSLLTRKRTEQRSAFGRYFASLPTACAAM